MENNTSEKFFLFYKGMWFYSKEQYQKFLEQTEE
jgi:hypothetical protein